MNRNEQENNERLPYFRNETGASRREPVGSRTSGTVGTAVSQNQRTNAGLPPQGGSSFLGGNPGKRRKSALYEVFGKIDTELIGNL